MYLKNAKIKRDSSLFIYVIPGPPRGVGGGGGNCLGAPRIFLLGPSHFFR